ncbi:unnamed protein product [Protopolystoma xenopodis]|uniref:Uncharacterized protein n=1 Tax=Protopolystoma xenopodis TaxID=117903 RepID=A0A3S5A9S7_9PLAT|nr:unnamed protein product [Protopolystoma xenopodis]
MTDESSARSHRGRRTVGRDFLCKVQQTRVQGNLPAVSGEANLPIPSTHLLKRNEKYARINILRDSSKPSFSSRLLLAN